MIKTNISYIILCLVFALNLFAYPTNWEGQRPVLLTPIKIDEVYFDDIWINPSSNNILIDKKGLTQILQPIIKKEIFHKIENSKFNFLSKDELTKFGININFDANELILHVNIPLKIRESKLINLENIFQKNFYKINQSPYSFFINNEVTNNHIHSENKDYKSIYNEYNLNIYKHVFNTGAFYNEQYENKKYIRDYSRYIFDFENQHARLTVGDLNFKTVGIQEQTSGLGISYQNDFSIQPTLLKTNPNSYEVLLKVPSLVTIYINKNRIYSQRHNAGILKLNELPLVLGENNIEVEVKGDNGKTETFYFASIYDSQLLPKGLSDFSLNILNRSQLNENSEIQYAEEDYFLSTFYRYGLSNTNTIGVDLQLYQENALLGFEYSKNLNIFNFVFTPSFSQYEDSTKSSASISFQKSRLSSSYKKLNLLSTFQTIEKDFTSVLGNELNTKSKWVNSISFALTPKSHIGIAFDYNEDHEQDIERLYSLNHYIALNNYVNLSSRFQYNMESEETVALFNLNITEKTRRLNSRHDYQTQDHTINNTLNYNNEFESTSLNASISHNKSIDNDTETNRFYANYQHPSFSLRADHTEGENKQTQISSRFAFALTNKSFDITKHISSSFLILETDSESKIYLDNEGKKLVSKRKSFVDSDLVHYQDNMYRLEADGLEFGETLPIDRIALAPSYKSGAYYKIETIKNLSIQFKLKSEKQSYYTGKLISVDGKEYDFMTGRSGQSFIESIKPGVYDLFIDSIGKVKKITIPNKKGFLRLGVIHEI